MPSAVMRFPYDRPEPSRTTAGTPRARTQLAIARAPFAIEPGGPYTDPPSILSSTSASRFRELWFCLRRMSARGADRIAARTRRRGGAGPALASPATRIPSARRSAVNAAAARRSGSNTNPPGPSFASYVSAVGSPM